MIPIMLAAAASIAGGGTPGVSSERAVGVLSSTPEFSPDALMDRLRSTIPNAKRLDTNPPFFWRSEISNDRLDSYYTRMAETTLRSFVDGATNGVSFQYSHDWKKLGLGKSLDGHFDAVKKRADKDGSATSMRALVDFYTVPGLRMNDQMGTDDFILGVETGLLFDVSVGFYAGRITCNICDGEMFNGWFGLMGSCDHFPGDTYPVLDKAGEPTGETQLCYAWIHDGTLSEVSQVYDGATPSAGHLKAELWANANRADARQIRSLEALYRVKLPGGAFVVRGTERDDMKVRATADVREGDPTPKADDVEVVEVDPTPETIEIDGTDPDATVAPVADDGTATPDETEDERAMLDDLQSTYGARGITLAPTARGTIEFLAEEVLRRGERITALTIDAKAGAAYRKKLMADGVRDGTAALGDGFDEAMYRDVFADLSIEKLESMVAGFTKLANERFPTGRKTTEGDKDNIVEFPETGKAKEPDSAFR